MKGYELAALVMDRLYELRNVKLPRQEYQARIEELLHLYIKANDLSRESVLREETGSNDPNPSEMKE